LVVITEFHKFGIAMKKIATVAASLAMLTGCVSQEFQIKQNVTYDQYQRDSTQCGAAATQQVGTNTQVGWAPYVGIYSVDANAGLRNQQFDICMRDKGYVKRSVPGCSSNATAAQQTGFGSEKRLNQTLKLAENSCYVLTPTGSRLLYTPPA
jgi:hypothetical protein